MNALNSAANNWKVQVTDHAKDTDKGSYMGTCSRQQAGNGDISNMHSESVTLGGKTYNHEAFRFRTGAVNSTGNQYFTSGANGDRVSISPAAFNSMKSQLGVKAPKCQLGQ